MSDFDALFKPVRLLASCLRLRPCPSRVPLADVLSVCCQNQKPKLKERMQTLMQPRSASAVSDSAATASAGSAVHPSTALEHSATTRVPPPAAAKGWTAKSRPTTRTTADNAIASGSAAAVDTIASSQRLDAYTSEFAWMRTLPAPAPAEAPPSATVAAEQSTAQGVSAQAAMVGHDDGELMTSKPRPGVEHACTLFRSTSCPDACIIEYHVS
jgi:hypothetical protein